jgi:molybdopterin molybdotransferase
MPGHLTDVSDARAAVLANARPVEAETVPLRDALGRCLAEHVVAPAPVQAFDNSAMDGYAIRAADTRGAKPAAPIGLSVAGESRAGAPAAIELAQGEAIAISTGAMLPAGADAVVRVEDVARQNGRIEVARPIDPGEDVRRAGEDIVAGATVLSPGSWLGAAELGAIAAVGRDAVRCRRRPRLAVLTSGDELRPPPEALPAGGAYDSSSFAIPALAKLAAAEVVSVARTRDEPGATRAAIRAALDADVTVVCGGVSVGEHDHVRAALADLGVEEVFWGVALKPGRPAWFGTNGPTLVFGLPGNPVSAMVTFTLLVRPALLAMQGADPARLRTHVALASSYEKAAGRAHALRARLELTDAGWWAHPAPAQGSHVITSMLGADCLALVPAATTSVAAGERLEAELLRVPGGAP